MRLFGSFIVVASALAIAVSAHARDAVPMEPFENIKFITGSGKAVEPEAARKAILGASDTGKRKWQLAPDGKGYLATTRWEDHSLTVRIEIGADAFSVRYADSFNLKYSIKDGKPVIHRSYNRLVADLVTAISGQLLKL